MGASMAKVVFQPPPSTYNKDSSLIWLHTDHNSEIPAFHINKPDRKYTLLFSHGNAEDLGLIIRYFREVGDILKVNVFSYEYTGYGMSSGEAKETTVYADIEAAYKYLRYEVGVPWQRIVPYGRSIGTGPSVHLATRAAVRGLILQSGMMSIYRIAFQFRFTLPGDLFANVNKIRSCKCPIFIVHGTRDEIVPVWHGHGLYQQAKIQGIDYTPYWVDGADHNNLEGQAGDEFYDRFRGYLDFLDATPISEGLRKQAENSDL